MKPKLQFHGSAEARFAVACLSLLLAVFLQPAGAQTSQDFGDAPTNNYPTLAAQNGARHTATGPMLGFARDTESNGLPNPNALGDDSSPVGGTDDEDGVTFLTLVVPGQSARVQVIASSNGVLNAWLDFNDDGDWNDAIDRLFTNVPLIPGANILTFPVPVAAVQGITFARFRFATIAIDTPTGAAANGEVEDYQVQISAPNDFSDAPTNSYPTLLAQNGARHVIVSNFFLGTRIDGEPDGQPNPNALGDDNLPAGGQDDEDGIVFISPIVAGSNATVQITCTMASTQTGRINAWLDFNRDGVWDPATETIFNDLVVANGVASFSFAVPGSASGGSTFARFRLSVNGKLQPDGSAQNGEVEDYEVNVTAALDYGDAPTNNYPTLLAQNGARHNFARDFCLGTTVDGELNGQPDPNAKGDDSNPAAIDDEDGVNFTSSIVLGGTASVQVQVTLPPGFNGAILNAWMDFNRDGDWADSGEQIFADRNVTPGLNNLTFSVPSVALPGSTFARFRLSSTRSIGFTGLATDGEVEDYQVNIGSNLDFGDAPKPYPTFLAENGARHTFNTDVFLGFRVDSEPDGQPEAAALGDDLNGPDEDGVTFTSPLVAGAPVTVQVRASTTGILHAWVDFNGNGSWADAGEKVFNGIGVSGGINNLAFNLPATAKVGPTFARFRFTLQTAILDFVGLAADGEVEDYRVRIIPDRERCDHNCEGKEYWLTFPGNYAPDPDNPARLNLCLMGGAGTVANVSVPGIGFTTNVVIPAAQAINVPLPRAAELGDLNDVVTNLGIHVIASAAISITAFDHARYTTDSYMALNASVIGTKYVVQGFGNTFTGVPPLNGTQFALVASESNTLVAIRPTANAGSRTAGVPYLLVLQPGEAYQLRSTDDAPADLSGTLIVSDKPIAVFGSHQIANIASMNFFFADYLVEQLLPVNTWGNNFFTAPLATRTLGDTFRVTSAYNGTVVSINGVAQPALNVGEFQQFTLVTGSHITSSRPVFLAQYANSGDFDGNTNSDPFMLTVPATRHYANSYRICTPTNDFPTNFANVVAPSGFIGTVLRDGVAIPGPFLAIGASGFSYARVPVTPGTHVFSSASTVFGLSVYGWAEYDSYGHPACMYFGDVVAPTVNPSTTGAAANVNDYPNTPGFVPSPNFASGTQPQDNCDPQPRIPDQDPKPGTLVPPGVHIITLSLEDNNGNIGETNVTFSVLDPSAVFIECPSNIVVNCQSNNGAIVDFTLTAHSTYDTNVPVASTPKSGSFFPAGTTIVTNVATSLAGQSNTCYFTVTVLCDTRIKVTPGQNSMSLSWAAFGTLQFATNPVGPWSNVVSGVNRYDAPLTGRQGFFRVMY